MVSYPIRFAAQLRQHLQALRKKNGLTQAQAGVLIGVTQARIAEIEANPGSVGFEQLLKLLSVLGASMSLDEHGQAAAYPVAQAAKRNGRLSRKADVNVLAHFRSRPDNTGMPTTPQETYIAHLGPDDVPSSTTPLSGKVLNTVPLSGKYATVHTPADIAVKDATHRVNENLVIAYYPDKDGNIHFDFNSRARRTQKITAKPFNFSGKKGIW